MEESHPCQFIAEFTDEQDARKLAVDIVRECDLDPRQLRVVPPTSKPASKFRVLGIGFAVGLLVGLLTAFLVIQSGDVRAVAEPGLTTLVLGAVNALIGMAFASMVSWRPRLINHLMRGRVPMGSSGFLLLIDMHDIAQQHAVREAFKQYPNVPSWITDSGYVAHDKKNLPF